MYLNIKKKLFFCLLFLVLIYIIIFNLFIFDKNVVTVDFILSSRKEIFGHVANLKINNINGIYNSDDNTFYFSVNNMIDNRINDIKVKSYMGLKYKIIDDDIYSFNDCKILLYNDKYYQILNVRFIPIPIISLYNIPQLDNINPLIDMSLGLDIKLKDNIVDSTKEKNIVVNISTADSYDGFSSFSYNINGSYHIRGASSLIFDKKSYKINLLKNDAILNFNSGKDWVLDALYNDSSKVRNKLSSDLWNLINNNQEQNNDLESKFVEVFIDDKYMGLYVLKNSVTRKMLNLNNDGILVKPFTDFTDYIKISLLNDSYIITDNVFLNFEIKYCNNIDEGINSFITKFKDIIFNNYDTISLNKNYHIENYVNYKVLVSFIMGVDNITKNNYISMKNANDKMLITPWDMDLTFGNNWDFNIFNGESFYFDSYSDKKWLDDNIINVNSAEINLLIKQRYWELRNDVINMDVINMYLDSYKELLVSSGAAKRDSNRWYYYDIENEIEKIREWSNKRIQFLDEYFKL